jgi:tetratricopeptide (TPR) repeat protein
MEPAQDQLLELALSSRALQEKLRYCTRYLESNPSDVDVWEYKGDVSVMLGQDDEVSLCTGKLTELIDKTSYLSGWAKFIGGNFEDALTALDSTLDEWPDYCRAWILKGYTLINLGAGEKSLQCFDRAIVLSASKLQKMHALAGKADALITLDRFAEAAQCSQKALDIDPVKGDALKSKGLCMYQLRRYQEAIDCFDILLDIDPNNETAKEALTLIEMRLGKKIKRHPKRY